MFFLFLPLSAHSECRVWPGCVAEVLPSGLSSVPQSQFCSSPGRSGGWSDAGCGGPAELRAATPGAVPVLDILLCLYPVCGLCCLLEHLRLQLAWCATAPATMTCLLEPDKTLYPLYCSTDRFLTNRKDESALISWGLLWVDQSHLTATVLHPALWCREAPDMQQPLLSICLPATFWVKPYHCCSRLPCQLTSTSLLFYYISVLRLSQEYQPVGHLLTTLY